MQPRVYPNSNIIEIALDEAGRGPLFGRLYVAAVILPNETSLYSFDRMCDSKKIKSKTKMKELATYIKQHAIAYHIEYVEATMIDKMNILQANMYAMHRAITQILQPCSSHVSGSGHCPLASHLIKENIHIIIDGNYFTPYFQYHAIHDEIISYPHTTIEKGDGKYCHIAAASILAKHARDEYILSLCEKYPALKTNYSLHTNMGYGTKQHMEGIRQYGITPWHRRSFAPCHMYSLQPEYQEEQNAEINTTSKSST